MRELLKQYNEEALIIKQIKDRSIIDESIQVIKQYFKDFCHTKLQDLHSHTPFPYNL